MSNAGRKAMTAATPVDSNLNQAALTLASAAADQMEVLQAGYGQDRDLLNQLLGQAQMASAFSDFSALVRTSKLAYVKENKLYQRLKGMPSPDGTEFSGTWAEFCKLLGRSVDMVDNDISNMRAFGEEALESMSRMGIGYRELRQYRKLPEDQKLALIEVAKTGDKSEFLDLAEEIIARHAKEKEALQAQVEEAQDTLEAKDRVLADKSAHIEKLVEQASKKFKPLPEFDARNSDEQKLMVELQETTAATHVNMRRLLAAADAAIEGGGREAVQLMASQAVEYLCQQLLDISTEFGITVNLEERLKPNWMSDEALAAMEKRQAEQQEAAGK